DDQRDAVRAVAEFRRAMAAALADSVGTMDVVLGELRTAFAEPDAIERAISLFTADVPTRDIACANSRLLLELEQLADRREEALRRLDALLTQCDDGARRARLLREKGDLLQLDGNNDRARRAYEESLNYDPDAWVALNNIAYLLSTKLADSDAAVGYALRAAAITPNGATLDTLGWAYVGAAQYAPAIAALSRCLRFDPDSAATFYHLGEAYRRKRDFADAARILQAVRRLAQGADDAEWVALADAAIAKAEGQDATP
ncbi:MAG: tetratricopeptide repeat protein, partial [Phycisphaerae bacterium]